ncbi:Ribulose bisphosphate carboxylase small chain [Rhynchospora pubera]|uniref:Ribulose bisphosphate carboxylase small subunit, chloroplastic n=1 Tax=Rhynchospora pubera TaxID=906938 RepID=A0AAV8F5G0_9POAL|nr:Ribulose bisphosphate carboxylase small chain [Rhynchospora pubera]KAJ4786331.1 Ribulose bisphosphate carboxylase small chain [Rhynchospora pubera]
MASVMISSAVTMARSGASTKSGNSIAPYVGFRQADGRKAQTAKLPSNRMKVTCMQKFETLSYLPDLSPEELLKQIEYLIRSNWIPCLEFSKVGFVYRENHRSPGYYDGRYWTMWKLPMFGCTDAAQVAKEVEEAKKEYPDAFIRILGFDAVRQVQCIMFIAYKPPGTY